MLMTAAAVAALTSAPLFGPIAEPAGQSLECIIMNRRTPPAERPSPLDSVSFSIGGGTVKVCYGRPSARGRTMIGGEAVPYGRIWRTGANEPTMIHTTVTLDIAGIRVGPGTYSLYTVPGEPEWEVIVNRSITQWGAESGYTEDVRAQEVGRGKVASERTDQHVEQFTIRADAQGPSGTLVLEWERTRVRIPVRLG
jgi:hypothetical protein